MSKQESDPVPLRPQTVYVCGMPLMFRGWNGAFDWNKDKECYEMRSHWYYGILINHATLSRSEEGRWSFKAEWGTTFDRVFKDNDGGEVSPLGDYGDFVVLAENSWWKSNGGLVNTSVVFIALIAAAIWLAKY